MSGDLLSIREPLDRDDSSFQVELSSGDEELAGTATLPRGRLAESDLSHVLSHGHAAAVGAAVAEYRQALVQTISLALERRLPLSGERPLTVVVEGGPGIHAPIWEALRDPSRSPGNRALVVRVPGASNPPAAPPSPTPADLTWLGARPFGEADIPRHLVAGAVLAAMLREGSALRPRAVRTDADIDDLEAVLLAPGSGARLTHLDVHGLSHIAPGGDLVDAVFSFLVRGDDGPVPVDDGRLRSLLASGECTLFSTNACFGAQQRGIVELPLPAQLVEDGTGVAVAAREPLAADAAATFFHAFYGSLSEAGTTIATAFAVATDSLMSNDDFGEEFGQARGRALRALLQPVLWARSRAHVERAFAAPNTMAGVGSDGFERAANPEVREAVAMTSLGGTIAGVAAGVEDAVWGSPERAVRLRAEPGCGLSAQLLDEIPSTLARLVRPGGATALEMTTLPVSKLTERERSWLICRRFSGRSAFLQLLIEVLDDDAGYLDALAERSGGEALPALLDALGWGRSAPDGRRPVALADSDLEAVFAERKRRLERGAGEDPESPPDVLGCVAALPLAMPLTSFDGSPIFGAATIAARGDPEGLFETFSDGRAAEMIQVDDRLYVCPHPRTQVLARAAVNPGLVLLMRGSEDRDGSELAAANLTWNRGTRLACLSWLSAAVAARQVGGIDVVALSRAMLVLGSLDRGATSALVEALEDGLPGWAPLIDSSASAYGRVRATIAAIDAPIDPASEDRADRALHLLHDGKPEAVLDLLEDATQLDFDEHKALCYALARTGHPEAAREGAARHLRELASMPLWDQCELLHLLGDIAEREGKLMLAARFMLDERKLNPPSASGRLHNRTHLLNILLELPRLDVDLAIQLAKEAILLAAELEREEVRQRYFGLWLRLVLGQGREAKLDELQKLEPSPPDASAPPPVRLAHGVALLRDGGDRRDEGAAQLLEVAAGDGWEAGHACQRLVEHDAVAGDRRIEVLRQGAGVADRREAELCLAALIAELWRHGDREEATQLAAAAAESLPYSAACVVAANVAAAGETEAAVKALGVLIAESGRWVLTDPRLVPILQSLPQGLTGKALDHAIHELIEGVSSHIAPPASGFDVSGSLSRLAEILELATQSRIGGPDLDRLAADLVAISEGLWEHERLDAAAQAREIACALLAVEGDPAKQAVEIGWLATLQRRRGRIRDSEAGFQRAIELGAGVLSATELSAIYGGYGNLLHDVGSIAAAVDLQWASLRLISRGVADDAPLDEPALQAVAGAGPIAAPLGALLVLRMANLANCLIDLPEQAAAEFLLRAAIVQIDRADPAEVNGREARGMLDRVATRLGLVATEEGTAAEGAATE